MNIPVDSALKDICHEIIAKEWSEQDWATLEDQDCFKSSRYFGGYNSRDRIFQFSFVDLDDEQHSIQFSLSDAPRILSGDMPEVEVQEPAEAENRKNWILKLLLIAGFMIVLGSAVLHWLTTDPAEEDRKQAEAGIDELAESLQRWWTASGTYPEPGKCLAPPDPWGTPYRIVIADDSPQIVSAGPDKEFDTPDDVK